MSGKRLVIPSVNRHLNKFLGAALTIFLAFLLACGTAGNEIRMGTEGAYPPYNFINDSGDLDGFELELGNELCRRANLKCTWVTNNWDAIISNLLDEQYDTIMAGMTITADRDELIDFTHSYFPPSPSVYVAQSSAGNEVVNGTVAAQVATIQAGYLAESGATLLEVELAEDVLTAVETGQADAALADKDFLMPFLEESEGRLVLVGPEVLIGAGAGIGVRETDDELEAKLNEAIDDMKEDGSLNALIVKWFGEDAPTF